MLMYLRYQMAPPRGPEHTSPKTVQNKKSKVPDTERRPEFIYLSQTRVIIQQGEHSLEPSDTVPNPKKCRLSRKFFGTGQYRKKTNVPNFSLVDVLKHFLNSNFLKFLIQNNQ